MARATAVKRSARVCRRVDAAEDLVALTFDDCDAEGPWLRILDVLAAHDARATFFANGFRIRRFARAACRTVAEGHEVGSHGFDHARLSELPPAEIRSRLEADRAVWRSVAGTRISPFLRPPFGLHDDVVAAAAADAGFSHVVLWDVDPQDWRPRDPRSIALDVVARARSGSIVELHATSWTAEALPRVLDRLHTTALRCARVSELLACASRADAGGDRGVRPGCQG